ncbi:hypothetical protein EYF80_059501 [Liparis tanakae]|uniref:Uncharacterized protein n=1 Tax=Liparis tanakae TaxID=230148 RepID=A0A4Z2EN32_9TELE|nr:hypothetical protein EYF80_059501 [Liparis tanakae]
MRLSKRTNQGTESCDERPRLESFYFLFRVRQEGTQLLLPGSEVGGRRSEAGVGPNRSCIRKDVCVSWWACVFSKA